LIVPCVIYDTTKPVLKNPDFAATFFMERVEGSMRRDCEGESVRIPIEQNIWRWAWLAVAILVFTVAIVLANAVR
jgi:hypothetical protein